MRKILENPFLFALIWVLATIKIVLGFALGYWGGYWHTHWLGHFGWLCDNPWLWAYVIGGINGAYSLAVAILFSWLFFIERQPPPNGNGREVILLKAA